MARTVSDQTRRRALQRRTLVTRSKIVSGAVEVLGSCGVPGLTHRAVAKAAGVSLAATTYHFVNLTEIIDAASQTLLADYLEGFRRLADRIRGGREHQPTSLDDVVRRVISNALGRDQARSLAWCELILHGARHNNSRRLASDWYRELDAIWHEIHLLINPGVNGNAARTAVDLAVGMTFTLHPLGLGGGEIEAQLDQLMLARVPLPAQRPKQTNYEQAGATHHAATRQKLIGVATAIIIAEGSQALTFARLAEALGMVRSGPSYYFASMDELIQHAQSCLFARAKQRYRDALSSNSPVQIDETRLVDLTTTILCREATEFARENIGYYSVWLNGARNPAIRPAIEDALADLNRAWRRRLTTATGSNTRADDALRVQALFTGKLIRAIATSIEIANLSTARSDLEAAIRAVPRH